MIEIKFVTADGDKHLGIIPTHVASSIQDVCEIISSNVTLQQSAIYGIKQADISDISNITDDDYCNEKKVEDGAYYKSIIKYVSVDDKVVKYSFLVWALDIDDARDRTKQLIEENSMHLAEVVEIKKTGYTAVIDEQWLDIELEVSAICAEGMSLEEAKDIHSQSLASGNPFLVKSEIGVELFMRVKQATGAVDFCKICPYCDHPEYLDTDGWKCKGCGKLEG